MNKTTTIKHLLTAILLMAISSYTHAQSLLQNISIDFSDHWEFQYQDQWYHAQVPGTIHTDLFHNDLISDPFWENNEIVLRWIENEDWIYKKQFFLHKNWRESKYIELQFDGLDTYADIYINDHQILSATNMFRAWNIDIKQWLIKGENTIEVRFRSPISENKEKLTNYPYELPAANETVDIKVSPFTRKAAYQFGWDWGPRFVGCGIWRSVRLAYWDEARIKDVHLLTSSLDKEQAIIEVELDMEVTHDSLRSYEVQINNRIHKIQLSKDNHQTTINYTIKDPKLWWPNGYGDAYLYDIDVRLLQRDKLIDSQLERIGLRTIELINKKDNIGTSFYFLVNGEAVFMKGANYIPQDIFLGNVTPDKYKRLLSTVKNSHMNMLRVWGGGIYENDIFYDLCDEKGILVWQDFMFAGSLYPDTKDFLDNIEEEVNYNIKRLRNHPCIAIWCGNNEIEVAWNNWGWQKQYGYNKKAQKKIWKNYQYIFEQMIPQQVKKLAPNTAYTSTSPLSNWGKPENFNHSSMHYWGVWHGKDPFKDFGNNVGRFMVEYGFQSFPSMELIKSFAADSSQYLLSAVMKNRQKSYIGNGLIKYHAEKWFGASSSFEDFVHKSRLVQAQAMKMAIKAHRKGKPHCMGTLFWQLNDCWPGPSWSVLDYTGYSKPAMDVVREYYKPVIAVIEESDLNIEVYIVSDLIKQSKGNLQLRLKSETGKLLWGYNGDYHIGHNTVNLVLQKSLSDFVNLNDRTKVRIEVALKDNEKIIFSDVVRFTPE